jgi:hypothetical protein
MSQKKVRFNLSVSIKNTEVSDDNSPKAKLQRTSTFLSKQLLEPLSPQSPLEKLKQIVYHKSPKIFRCSQSLSKSSARQSISHEHSPDGFKSRIINLPKLPYGKHSSYNEEKGFLRNHFVFDDSEATESQLLTIKLALKEKYKKKRKKIRLLVGNKEKLRKIEEFRSQGGKLFINKDYEGHRNYEMQKCRYVNLAHSSTPSRSKTGRRSIPSPPHNLPSVFVGNDLPFMF